MAFDSLLVLGIVALATAAVARRVWRALRPARRPDTGCGHGNTSGCGCGH